jgi:hypothetical protein
MKTFSLRLHLGLLAISLVGLILGGCCTGGGIARVNERFTKAQANLLERASEAAGIDIQVDQRTTVSSPDAQVLVAPARYLERVPATQLPQGVNVGFGYIESRRENIPHGYYTFRAIADVTGPGMTEGRMQLIDSQGRVAAEVPATVEVYTMQPPDPLPFQATDVTLVPVRPTGGRRCNYGSEICYCCPNGWVVCTHNFLVLHQVEPSLIERRPEK